MVPVAVLVTALLAGVATWTRSGSMERDLAARAQTALFQAGLPTGDVRFDGRDATLSGFPPTLALRALEIVQNVDGVRAAKVNGDVTPVAPSGSATATATATTTTSPPAETTTTSSSPPPTTSTTAPPPTDKAGVQAEIDRMLTETPIAFVPDSAQLTPDGEQAARSIAIALAKAPDGFRYRVTGHVARGPGGENAALRLSQARARAVARILTANGLAVRRVTYRGLGDTRPVTGGEEDRRVEITVV
ncbi:OmpA family protein [Amycolatopsis sp. cmx-4-61]|uniref:OmpA family protein n=1 Tax=Amycolatopsis sp. cmx-4-61 TaxID=2790937 RepID=UPI00397AC8A3